MANPPYDGSTTQLQDTPHLPQPVPTGAVPPQSDLEWREGINPAADSLPLQMGGVPLPSAGELQAMHDADYILHAADGRMQRRPVEKVRLPPDPGSVQAIGAARGPDGAVYAAREESIFKSVDGGSTWTTQPHGRGPGGEAMPAETTAIRWRVED